MSNIKLNKIDRTIIKLRYLLGADVEKLAKKFNVTTRTIYRHVK